MELSEKAREVEHVGPVARSRRKVAICIDLATGRKVFDFTKRNILQKGLTGALGVGGVG